MNSTTAYYVAEEITAKYRRHDLINFEYPKNKVLYRLQTHAQIFTLLSYIYMDYCISYLRETISLALDEGYAKLCMIYDRGKNELLFLPTNKTLRSSNGVRSLRFTSCGLVVPKNMTDDSYLNVFSAANQSNTAAFSPLQCALFESRAQQRLVATVSGSSLRWNAKPDYSNLFISERVMPKILQQASDLLFLHTNNPERPNTDTHVSRQAP